MTEEGSEPTPAELARDAAAQVERDVKALRAKVLGVEIEPITTFVP